MRCMSLWCSLIVLSSRLVFSHGGSPGSAGSGTLLPGNHARKTTNQDPDYTVENTQPSGSGLCWGNHFAWEPCKENYAPGSGLYVRKHTANRIRIMLRKLFCNTSSRIALGTKIRTIRWGIQKVAKTNAPRSEPCWENYGVKYMP